MLSFGKVHWGVGLAVLTLASLVPANQASAGDHHRGRSYGFSFSYNGGSRCDTYYRPAYTSCAPRVYVPTYTSYRPYRPSYSYCAPTYTPCRPAYVYRAPTYSRGYSFSSGYRSGGYRSSGFSHRGSSFSRGWSGGHRGHHGRR